MLLQNLCTINSDLNISTACCLRRVRVERIAGRAYKRARRKGRGGECGRTDGALSCSGREGSERGSSRVRCDRQQHVGRLAVPPAVVRRLRFPPYLLKLTALVMP